MAPEQNVVRLLCPSCGNILKLPLTAGGRKGKCPKCQTAMNVAKDLGALWLESEAVSLLSKLQKPSRVTAKPHPIRTRTVIEPDVLAIRSGPTNNLFNRLINSVKKVFKSVEIITNSIGMELIEIPAGSFWMGSSVTEKDRQGGEAQVSVTLTQSFELGKYEVTQGQWQSVMGTEPWKEDCVKADKDCPATGVSWEDATEFCKKLTATERKSGKLKTNEEYRLPTEAEWEYACRAGTTTTFSFGDDERQLGEYAWFDGNADNTGEDYAHKVGLKKPNPWGLHDMHGNVWEWCSDWYGIALSGGTDPIGPEEGSGRVLRGGSWRDSPGFCRSANRNLSGIPSSRNDFLGFRVARSQSAQ